MKAIYEGAADTAKKVRKALKATFPGTKFSVTSSNYSGGCSVHVSWTDGPMYEKVTEILNSFKSTSFDGMTDSASHHGYMYEGQLYSGADYVTPSRTISKEYRAMIDAKASEMYQDYDPQDWSSNRIFNEVERMLSEVPQVEETEPVIEEFETSNVIKFTPNEPATSKQLWALHCITKLDTRNWLLTKSEASALIGRAKKGSNILPFVGQIEQAAR